jgi:hypothetical protein
MGGWLKRFEKTYPVAVKDIRVRQKCSNIYLLHAANFIIETNYNTAVAKLVFHYADGGSHETNIVAGVHVYDWWCPLFKTGIPERFSRVAEGTERAWTGYNPRIRRLQPLLSLVLYRTIFKNPRPDVELASLDYVSTETITAPFMVGLTVE